MESLNGKRVLVSGGTRGIGLAIARQFGKAGAKVAVFSRDGANVEEALAELPDAIGLAADVGKHDDVIKVVDWIRTEWGGLDVLVSNAGVAGDSVLDSPYEEWHEVVHTNLVGSMDLAAEGSKLMSEGGFVLFIGSISADERGPGGNVYVATKSGLQGFAEAFGKAVAEKGIRVTNLEPGLVESDMTDKPGRDAGEEKAERRMLDATEIGRVAVFLASLPTPVQIPNVVVQPLKQEE